MKTKMLNAGNSFGFHMQMVTTLLCVAESRNLAILRARLVHGARARRQGGCFTFAFALCETFPDGEYGVDNDGIDAFGDLVLVDC